MTIPTSIRTLCLSGAVLALMTAGGQAADLTVSVAGVRNTTNAIRIALYADSETFRHEKDARQVLSLPAVSGTTTGVFHDVPPGRYAVLAYHDENGNQKLDMILGMFPDEGWGLSNDPTIIGPPRFDDSVFDVPAQGQAVTVPLHY